MNDSEFQQKSFDQQADSYEKLYGDQSEFETEIVEKRKQLILGSPSVKTALDIGCGTGTFLGFISKKAKKVFAVDASEKMVQKAKERTKKEKLPNVEIMQAYAEKLPFKTGQFETIYCINTFYHIKEKEKTIAEIARALKKGGTAYIEFYNILNPFVFLRLLANPFEKNMPHVYPDTAGGIKKMLEKNQLQVQRIEVLSHVETSQAVKRWLPGFLFHFLLWYRKFSDRFTIFRLPKMRCIFVAKKTE